MRKPGLTLWVRAFSYSYSISMWCRHLRRAGLLQLGLEFVQLVAHLLRQAVAELLEVLAKLGQLGLDALGVHVEQPVQVFAGDVEAVGVEVVGGRNQSDRR